MIDMPGLPTMSEPEAMEAASAAASAGGAGAEEALTTQALAGTKAQQRSGLVEMKGEGEVFEAAWRSREKMLVQSLEERTVELERLRKAHQDAVKNQEILSALAGHALMPGAAQQLVKLWRDDLDCYDENGSIRVTSRDGKSVSELVSERLRQSEYAHFARSQARGGPGQRGGERQVLLAPLPKTLGESVLMQWQAQQSQGTSGGPVGLVRKRY